MYINISMSEEGKQMSYSDFKRLHKHHYKTPDSEDRMKSDYKELTGNVIKRRNKKADKEVRQSGNLSDRSDEKSGSI